MAASLFRKGRTVSLKPLEMGHAPILKNWLNDPELTQFMSRSMPVTEYEQFASISYMIKSKDHFAFVIDIDQDKTIGVASVYEISWPHRRGKIGIVLGERNHWGQGIAGEATMLLLDFVFNSLDLFAVAATALSNHEHAISTNVHAGFVEVGRIPKWIRGQNGERLDEITFLMTQEAWRPLWDEYRSTGKAFVTARPARRRTLRSAAL
jgi:RimJ/RimL family protein N-acetyltransferase